MNLRLTEKLNVKIDGGPRSTRPLNANPYADWSADLFTAARTQYILLANTPSLYSCCLYGRGISSDGQFIERALSTIREFLEDDGLGDLYHELIAPYSARVVFAKALNRQVTGSLNELKRCAMTILTAEDIAPHCVSLRLNDIPMTAIAGEGDRGYSTPRKALLRLSSRKTD